MLNPDFSDGSAVSVAQAGLRVPEPTTHVRGVMDRPDAAAEIPEHR
jgi:hypothetical protein